MRYIGPRRALLSGGTPPSLDLRFTAGGGLDPRITFTRASTGSYFDYTGTLQSAATNVARFDYDPVTLAARGLLIEEARTNSIRNSTMVGAAAGTPGTPPTNWPVFGTATGVTASVVGSGTESGIPYVDVAYSGTPSSATTVFINPFDTSYAAAATGQAWTASAYLRLTAGSASNVAAWFYAFTEYTSGSSYVIGGSVALVVPTIAGLATQRQNAARILSGGATTTLVNANIAISVTAGQAISFTLRIGAPQLELGAFATSAILTSGAAATRAADVATMPVGSWFNASAICVALEGTMLNSPVGGAGNSYWFSLDDGTAANRITLLTPSAGARVATVIVSGGITGANQDNVLVLVPPASFKYAIQVAGGVYTSCQNGGFYKSYATTAPVGITRFALGTGGDTQINGYIRRVRYWPRAMSPAELQANTR